jgi:hypothetical protein
VGGAARVPHQAGADGRLAKNGAEALLAPVSGGAENGTGSSAKAVNGKVYAPGPTVGRAAVAGMEDEDD